MSPEHSTPGSEFRTYTMLERALHQDFGIRCQKTALPNDNPHAHDYFQIHVQISGDTIHQINDTVRPVTANTICFIPPSKVHFIPTVTGSRYYILNASSHYLLPWLQHESTALDHLPIERAPELMPFRYQEAVDFVLSDHNMRIAKRLCRQLLLESGQRRHGSSLMIRGCLLKLISLAWREYGHQLNELSDHGHPQPASQRLLARLHAFLEQHVSEPMTLTRAAQAIHVTPEHLARTVKRESGQTFTEILTQLRLSQAKRLLIHSNMPIKQISDLCGYADPSYFGRRFQQVHACTPATFRRRARTQTAG